MWRNNEENDLLRADTSCQPVQASGFFPLYDAVSDKVWYGQFLYVGILTCHANGSDDELHSPPSSEDDDNPLPITILGHEHLSAYAFRGNGANRWQRRGQIYLAITDFQIISKGYRIIAYKHANTISEAEEMQF
uniref:Uncharacterized protein n=1 Tax=Salix viminalis TaxID=40686 RepID=A0A6N2LNE0_SALVM